ncbi:MAG: aconitate hydratase AcnA [Verrucomicrobia bacterium]|nr:MAG: aconitate hydratase AcnA [Verrucomicrobiota bacterium]
MHKLHNTFNGLKPLTTKSGKSGFFYALPALEEAGLGKISRLPISIRIVLESVLRNCGKNKITEQDVKNLAAWNPLHSSHSEVPFVVSRILLQDFTGVPLLVDLAAMRDASKKMSAHPELIEPLVPVDLVIDHSVQVDRFGTQNALEENIKYEFHRNEERYEFLKWGQQAFETFTVVPPAIGIVHQVNLEYIAKCVFTENIDNEFLFYPDTLVGTDSHTTMINGLGIVGWGVGGIEAEAGMLGQPIYIQSPEVIGVHMSGQLQEGVTATDLTLFITQFLRKEKVVNKFIEYFGPGAASLSVADRATIANMSPEYGATIGFFPIDEKTIDYMAQTGRSGDQLELIEAYYRAQNMWGIPSLGQIDYTRTLEINLSDIVPSVSGPKRPQDLINLTDLSSTFSNLLKTSVSEGGYGKTTEDLETTATISNSNYPENTQIKHGSVLIAAITSCTNTSNPSVMIAAGLLAKKAIEQGLSVPKTVKTSLAPGSRIVTDYLIKTGLQEYLNKLGFNLVGYGCTTCIGNSGPLDPALEDPIRENNLIVASVLSGNRNFEARIHHAVKANFLMSPPLVVAYALAGNISLDIAKDPIGTNASGKPIYLKDIWPTTQEIQDFILRGINPEMYIKEYSEFQNANPDWNKIKTSTGNTYQWKESSTYIQNPPFFENFNLTPRPITPLLNMRPLAFFGDSVTTDHISPAGNIPENSPAGEYLKSKGVDYKDFNSYGSRRGNDRVMTRGTFANVRIKNLILEEGQEGGFTKLMPDNEVMTIFDACEIYKERNTPLIVFAGFDYGMGSSRDWAAKGTFLLGVKAVVAKSFERIHRSNLIGMGVLPLEYKVAPLTPMGFDGTEIFSLEDLNNSLQPNQELKLKITKPNGDVSTLDLIVRIDTPIEVQYYRHGGILPFVLRSILEKQKT